MQQYKPRESFLSFRVWCPKFAPWLNIKLDIVQKVYEWSSCPFAKKIPPQENHFGQRTVSSLIYFFNYRKVASSSLSRLVAHFQISRRLMKGKFDAYVLWPLAKKFQNWIVDRSTARDFTVCLFWYLAQGQILGITLYLLGKVLGVLGKVLPITFKSGKSFENSEKGFSPKIPRERKGKERLSVLLYKILVVFEVR